jgi:hypothetical protein
MRKNEMYTGHNAIMAMMRNEYKILLEYLKG